MNKRQRLGFLVLQVVLNLVTVSIGIFLTFWPLIVFACLIIFMALVAYRAQRHLP